MIDTAKKYRQANLTIAKNIAHLIERGELDPYFASVHQAPPCLNCSDSRIETCMYSEETVPMIFMTVSRKDNQGTNALFDIERRLTKRSLGYYRSFYGKRLVSYEIRDMLIPFECSKFIKYYTNAHLTGESWESKRLRRAERYEESKATSDKT